MYIYVQSIYTVVTADLVRKRFLWSLLPSGVVRQHDLHLDSQHTWRKRSTIYDNITNFTTIVAMIFLFLKLTQIFSIKNHYYYYYTEGQSGMA